jgi:PTS system nitrogen regulatory IIA component
MNSIAPLLTPNDILLDLNVGDKRQLFSAIGQTWQAHQGIAAALVEDSLMAREALGSTGLGHEIAIPHARVKGLERAHAAFVRTQVGIDFDAPDGEPVSYFFVLLVPEHPGEEHLQVLAHAAEILSTPRIREQLASATTGAAVYALFSEWESAY